MKILFISNKFYPDIGGIEVFSEILADSFVKNGQEIRMITWTKEIGNKTFPYTIIRNPTFLDLLVAHFWADVVYESNPCLRMSWPNLFFKKPLVVTLHTWLTRTDGSINWQDKFKKYWLKRASASIAVSEAIKSKAYPKTEVIANPFKNDVFSRLPHVEKKLDFIFLGRLVSDKGVDMAINALHLIRAKKYNTSNNYSNLQLTVVGDGPERFNLEELAQKLGLRDHVIFKGSLVGEELVYCLNQHKFMLVPSIWEEPFGIVALEGMACGCIPIVSNRGGLPDAIGKAGLTFTSGDLNSLVQTIEKVLENGRIEADLRNESENHLKSHYPEIISDKYLEIIKGVTKI